MRGNVVVISLPSASARRERMSKLLAEHGLTFQFFDAVDGRQPPGQQRAALALPHAGPLFPAELGCALSHIDVWKSIAASAGSGLTLILEDDVHLSAGFAADWNGIAAADVPDGIYRFETMLASVTLGMQPVWKGRSCAFHPMQSAHGGTAAYALNAPTAAALLASCGEMREAVDIELFHHARSSIRPPPVYQAYPALAIQDMFLPEHLRTAWLGSQIVARRDQQTGVAARDEKTNKAINYMRNAGRPLVNRWRSLQLRSRGMFRRLIPFATP